MPAANRPPQIQIDAGRPSQTALPRYSTDGGRSNRFCPPVMPICRPRSTISMPSVTMNADSPNRRISRPLNAPTASADQQADRDRQRRRPAGAEAVAGAGMTSADGQRRREADGRLQRQVELAGDQDDRLGEHQQRQLGLLLQHVDDVGGGQEDRVDDRSRRRRSTRSPVPGPGRAAGPGAAPRPGDGGDRRRAVAVVAARTSSWHEVGLLPRRRPARVAPAARQLGDDPAVEHHQHPVAVAQVVELVGDHQHGGAARRPRRAPRRAATPWSARRRPRSG